MDKEVSGPQKAKRSAEEWVNLARQFGEDCLNIQRDTNLNMDKKLKEQEALSNQLMKQIQEDHYLSENEKQQMIRSIHTYMQEWKDMHDNLISEAKKDKTDKDFSG